MIMRKHCGNCANHKKETNQFSEECGKCVSTRLENGETTDPSHWREKPKTNADRIRAMSDEELAVWMAECNAYGERADASQWLPWLKQPAEDSHV
jgi:uncharacterized cysteine cluster protein YcgN (CxxCxxCC family)